MDLIEHWAHLHALVVQAAPPDPGGGTPPPGAEKINTLISWVAWMFFAFCVVGILWAGGQMVADHTRGMGGGDGTSRLVRVLIAAILGASASAIIGVLAG